MIVTVTGASKKLTKELTEAAHFFAHQLMHPRMVQNIQLDIDLYNKLDVNGECVSEDDTKNPRWFTINLRKKMPEGENMIQVLAHEMVHVKQYAKNELSKQMRLTRRGIGIGSKWHGEFWDAKSKEDEYWDSPWEIEAYGREVGLYYRWVAREA